MEHRLVCKVYYEDTDSLGLVYYANYLKYLERGRSEWVEQAGHSVRAWNEAGYLIVVHALQMTFHRPALLSDQLEIVSAFTLVSPFRGLFHQRVERAGTLLVSAEVEVACLDVRRRLRRFPTDFRQLPPAADA